MQKIDILFLRVGALYLMLGLVSDLFLTDTRFDLLAGSHAHLYMIGFGLHAIFGMIYCHWPELKSSRLARIHSALFFVGAPMLIIGSALPQNGGMNNPVLFGSLFVFLGCLAFTMVVFNIQRTIRPL